MTLHVKDRFLDSIEKFADKEALDCHDGILSYKELGSRALNLVRCFDEDKVSKVGIFGDRDVLSYVTLFASVISLRTFVPLNQRFPVKKLIYIIEKSDLDTIYVSKNCLNLIVKILPEVKRKLKVYVADTDAATRVQGTGADIRVLDIKGTDSAADANLMDALRKVQPALSHPLYIIFTSGTTGDPKGVEVSFDNMAAFLDAVSALFNYSSDDRIAQVSDITFDLSQGEIFAAFSHGAALVVVYPQYLFAFASFLDKKQISCVTLVPSAALLLNKMGLLEEGGLKSLRLCNFLGEALPYSACAALSKSAINADFYNTYGPTEATVAISYFKVDDFKQSGNVPIGFMYDRSVAILCAADGTIAKDEGEICLGGPQICNGYYKNEAKNASAFFMHDGMRFYRTGDLGCYDMVDDRRVLVYKGRIDDEVKVQGFRVSLLEIDEAFVSAFKVSGAAVALYDNLGSASIALVVHGKDNSIDKKEIINTLKEMLPFYMLPSKIIFKESMPYNANGKLDRKALFNELSS